MRQALACPFCCMKTGKKGGNALKELLQNCSEATGVTEAQAEAVIRTFLDGIVSQLSKGKTVDLGDDFGVFTAQLRTGEVREGSPRSPKASRYRVFFRENKGMRKKLKLPTEDAAEKEAVHREME